jgi:hypothetical protein
VTLANVALSEALVLVEYRAVVLEIVIVLEMSV